MLCNTKHLILIAAVKNIGNLWTNRQTQRYKETTSTRVICNSLSLCFNGHFPGEPRLTGVYWSKGWWKWCWQLEL